MLIPWIIILEYAISESHPLVGHHVAQLGGVGGRQEGVGQVEKVPRGATPTALLGPGERPFHRVVFANQEVTSLDIKFCLTWGVILLSWYCFHAIVKKIFSADLQYCILYMSNRVLKFHLHVFFKGTISRDFRKKVFLNQRYSTTTTNPLYYFFR
jgi:hypothetical protein